MHVHLQTISQTVNAFFMCVHPSEVFSFLFFSFLFFSFLFFSFLLLLLLLLFFLSVLNMEDRSIRKQAYLFFRWSDFLHCYLFLLRLMLRSNETKCTDANTDQAYHICSVFKQGIFHEIPVSTLNTLRTVEVILHHLSVCIRFKWDTVTAAWRPHS